MTPLQYVELAPFSRNIQHFHRLVDRIICTSGFKYMLHTFKILLCMSLNGVDVLCILDFKGAPHLSDTF
jgi:hypothetical protein